MNTILFISIAFPPKADAEGLQVAKYLKYLLREGKSRFAIDAVTSAHPTLNMSYDPSLEAAANGVRQVIELPIFENRYSNYLLRKVAPWATQSPDSKFSFHWQACRVPKLLEHVPDLIYSRAFPLSSAVMACKLKKRFNVPWVMHLSDIWADCPEMRYRGRSMSYQQKVERECFEMADAICVTSHKTLEFYHRKYPELGYKLQFFPNVFDSEDLAGSSDNRHAKNERLRIVHTGSLAGDRSPEPLLKAIHMLPKEIQDQLDIVFIGSTDRKNRALLEKYRCDCLSCFDAMEYRKALEIQRSADVLLLIDMPVKEPELRVFFPSKTLDYMLARKPILALVDDGSEIHHLVDNNGMGTCVDRDDVEGIQKHLLWLLSARDSDYFDAREVLPEYDAAYNAKRLIGLFDEFLQVQSAGSGRAGVR